HLNLPAAISLPIWSSPLTIARDSAVVSTPIAFSIVACAIEPAMSWRHSRQSKEMDSENAATSAPGSPAKRPLRETGEYFFMFLSRGMWGEAEFKSPPILRADRGVA